MFLDVETPGFMLYDLCFTLCYSQPSHTHKHTHAHTHTQQWVTGRVTHANLVHNIANISSDLVPAVPVHIDCMSRVSISYSYGITGIHSLWICTQLSKYRQCCWLFILFFLSCVISIGSFLSKNGCLLGHTSHETFDEIKRRNPIMLWHYARSLTCHGSLLNNKCGL